MIFLKKIQIKTTPIGKDLKATFSAKLVIEDESSSDRSYVNEIYIGAFIENDNFNFKTRLKSWLFRKFFVCDDYEIRC